MTELRDAFRAMDEAKKERHQVWKDLNMAVLEKCGLNFSIANNGETIMFRIIGKPRVDFFPSTGRWRSKGMTYRGGAEAFLVWFKKQAKE